MILYLYHQVKIEKEVTALQENTNTEAVYLVLDEGAELLKREWDLIYLDALSHVGDMVHQGQISRDIDEKTSHKLEEIFKKLPEKQDTAPEEYRRALQLAVLKGMREATQPHHALTPDAVSLFIGYLVNKLQSYDKKSDTQVLADPAVGAGNLMTAVLNQLDRKAAFIGADPDETLLKLAYINANLQSHSVDLFHQDSVSAPFVKNLDMIVSDLPAGYYPKEDQVSNFATKADTGRSYVHHLLIEKAVTHVKPGGFLIFLVPNYIFQTDQSEQLHTFIKEEALIYSLMQLPSSMFKNKQAAKSILVLRKKKEGIIEPKQALLAELPSFTKESALADMMQKISGWFDDHLKQEK
ncbi:site-specific DNA-methyltransferase (adenine-specific) [Salipaludibacillus aurantiacus]|uniref:Site-specific DNA-methyltransferase (Adenine-specific) n=2 Tax=Salipaludibacillus aurantiacus TaxID=1601833 RepID=A0A1H9WP73_9BACI|nr:site-specific DNA-methyltransferase (adenine-specific) [Salipaludibacillus aurantiacus]